MLTSESDECAASATPGTLLRCGSSVGEVTPAMYPAVSTVAAVAAVTDQRRLFATWSSSSSLPPLEAAEAVAAQRVNPEGISEPNLLSSLGWPCIGPFKSDICIIYLYILESSMCWRPITSSLKLPVILPSICRCPQSANHS